LSRRRRRSDREQKKKERKRRGLKRVQQKSSTRSRFAARSKVMMKLVSALRFRSRFAARSKKVTPSLSPFRLLRLRSPSRSPLLRFAVRSISFLLTCQTNSTIKGDPRHRHRDGPEDAVALRAAHAILAVAGDEGLRQVDDVRRRLRHAVGCRPEEQTTLPRRVRYKGPRTREAAVVCVACEEQTQRRSSRRSGRESHVVRANRSAGNVAVAFLCKNGRRNRRQRPRRHF